MRRRRADSVSPAMTLSRSCRSQQYITGRSPLGAQVRRTSGWSIRPVSSRNSTLRPDFAAFFYAGPVDASPPGDRLFIPLAGPGLGLLATPAQRQQDSPNLAGMILHAESKLDYLGDVFQRPQFGREAVMGWPLPQQIEQPSSPRQTQFQRPARTRLGPKRLKATETAGLTPSAN